MALTKNQPKRGAQHRVSENPTNRAGRDDGFVKNQPQRGVKVKDSANPTVKAGRDSGLGPNQSHRGVHGVRGAGGADNVKRLDDGVANA